MSLANDLKATVSNIFKTQWTERDGRVVPSADDVRLGNDAVKLDGVVLYADMSESTKLVDTKQAFFAAEIYKSYLHCAAKIIKAEGGEITAYDGDRIMAVFVGDYKNSSAAIAALKINYARVKIINPAINDHYQQEDYQVKHTVGIDASQLFIARTGVRGANDLVWVGKSANHAAKLCELPNEYATRITETVYNKLSNEAKFSNGKPMWEKVTWNTTGRTIYRSNWRWVVS